MLTAHLFNIFAARKKKIISAPSYQHMKPKLRTEAYEPKEVFRHRRLALWELRTQCHEIFMLCSETV
jgi:hypothetical protein